MGSYLPKTLSPNTIALEGRASVLILRGYRHLVHWTMNKCKFYMDFTLGRGSGDSMSWGSKRNPMEGFLFGEVVWENVKKRKI